MELQFLGQTCACLQSAVWENKTEELTQEVRLSDGMADVGSILGAWGQILVRSKEWRDRQMSISGGVTAWAMYSPENGGMPETVEVWMPFHLHWDIPESKRDGNILVSCAVRSVDARSVSARRIMFRSVISVTGEGMIPSQMEVFMPCDVPEDVQLLTRSYPMRLPKEAGEKTFVLDEELNLSSDADDTCKLVRCCVQPEIVDKKIMADKAVFRGAAIVDMLCLCESGKVVKQSFEIPFSQFTELSGEYGPGATLWMNMALTSVEPELLADGVVRVKAGLIGQYTVHDTVQMNVVEDAYSTVRSVEPQSRILDVPAVLEEKQELIKAEQLVADDGFIPLDMGILLGQPEIYHENDSVSIELSGMFQCLGTGADNNYLTQNATWKGALELPSSQSSKVLAWAQPTGKPQAAQTADGVLLKQDILVDTRTVSKTGIPMITALTLGEMQEPNGERPSLILCRAGQNSLWELAKTHGSTMDAIRQLNGFADEPDGDKMLLIPVL